MILHNHTSVDSPRVKAKDILDMILEENAMLTTGNQTVAGKKTHTSIPVLPGDPTTDNQMSNKGYLDTVLEATVVATDDYLQDSADTERAIADVQTTYIKKKQIRVNEAGTIRIKFDMKDDNGAGGCFGRIYKNGGAVGTERERTGNTWVTYSEDLVSDGTEEDFQLYMKYDDSGGGIGGLCRNFRIYYYKKLDIVPGTVNLD